MMSNNEMKKFKEMQELLEQKLEESNKIRDELMKDNKKLRIEVQTERDRRAKEQNDDPVIFSEKQLDKSIKKA